MFGRASGMIRYILLAVFLSRDQWALISFAHDFGEITRSFIDGGLDNLISRDGARRKNELSQFFANGLLLKMSLALIFFFGSFFYLYQVRDIQGYELLVVYAALAGSMLLSFTGVIRSCFTALERMEYVFYTNLPSRLIAIALLFLVLWLEFPLIFAAAAVSIENFLWFFLLGLVALRFFTLTLKGFSFSQIFYMISESWPLPLYGFFNIFYLKLDVLMIEYVMGHVDYVGPYTYASRLISGLTMLLTGYIIAIYPALSRYHETDEPAYKRLFNISCQVILVFTIPTSALLCFWSGEWMALIPNTIPVSGEILGVLGVNLNLSMLNTLFIITFTSKNRQRWLVLFTGGAVLLSFVSNWYFIQYFQQVGAAWASLISQAVLLLFMGWLSIKLFALPIPIKRISQFLLVTLLSAIIVRLIPFPHVLLVPFLYGALLLFFGWLFRVVTPADIQTWKNAIKKD